MPFIITSKVAIYESPDANSYRKFIFKLAYYIPGKPNGSRMAAIHSSIYNP